MSRARIVRDSAEHTEVPETVNQRLRVDVSAAPVASDFNNQQGVMTRSAALRSANRSLKSPQRLQDSEIQLISRKNSLKSTQKGQLPEFTKPNSKQNSLISETFYGRKRLYYIDQNKLKNQWESEQDQNRWLSKVKSFFRSMFMPIGYPHSVHSVYAKVHIWQFFEYMMGSAVIDIVLIF
jgi:hypothetical protein